MNSANPCQHLRRLRAAVFLLCSFIGFSPAVHAATGSTATIRGTVSDAATATNLNHASVQLTGLPQEYLTERDGSYGETHTLDPRHNYIMAYARTDGKSGAALDADPTTNTTPTRYDQFSIVNTTNMRHARNVGLNLDYRLGAHTVLKLNLNHNDMLLRAYNARMNLPAGTALEPGATAEDTTARNVVPNIGDSRGQLDLLELPLGLATSASPTLPSSVFSPAFLFASGPVHVLLPAWDFLTACPRKNRSPPRRQPTGLLPRPRPAAVASNRDSRRPGKSWPPKTFRPHS